MHSSERLSAGLKALPDKISSFACVTVWAIAANKSKEAAELKTVLIKLSGRQMRHKKAFTNPALHA